MSPTEPNGADDPMRVEHRYDADTPPSIALVEAIASLENVRPTEFSSDLGVRLYDHVDPEALDRLVADSRDSTAVSVELTLRDGRQYAVVVHDTGRLLVRRSN